MSAPRIIIAFLPTLWQKLSKLVKILRKFWHKQMCTVFLETRYKNYPCGCHISAVLCKQIYNNSQLFACSGDLTQCAPRLTGLFGAHHMLCQAPQNPLCTFVQRHFMYQKPILCPINMILKAVLCTYSNNNNKGNNNNNSCCGCNRNAAAVTVSPINQIKECWAV